MGTAADRLQVVVHIHQAVLSEQQAAAEAGRPHRCELEDGPALALDTARRLACDASVVGSVEGGGRVARHRPQERSIPLAISRALKARDGGCRFPRCDRTRFCDGPHLGLGATLGLLALTLSAVGIYGVVAYFVGRRTRELAIRVALGARPGDVLAMILRRTMRPVVIGGIVGLLGATGVSRVLSSVLFGVSPFDPIGIGIAVVFVLAVAFAAGFLPGHSAVQNASRDRDAGRESGTSCGSYRDRKASGRNELQRGIRLAKRPA